MLAPNRLLTELLRERRISSHYTWPLQSLFEGLETAVPIIADNVSQYFYTVMGRDALAPSDYPTLAPPFPLFWIETQGPDRTVLPSSGTSVIPAESRMYVGCLFYGCDAAAHRTYMEQVVSTWSVAAALQFHQALAKAASQWVLFWDTIFWVPFSQRPPLLAARHGLVLDESGSVIPRSSHEWIDGLLYRPHESGEHLLDTPNFCLDHLLALSFMHCKNVRLTDPEPRERYDRAARHRGEKPPVRFHTIEIKPMQAILEQARADSGGDLRRALHICRGHFKNYRDGGGLFGKLHGLYWWEAQVRGHRKEGTVVSTYKVDPPSPESP